MRETAIAIFSFEDGKGPCSKQGGAKEMGNYEKVQWAPELSETWPILPKL